MKKRVKNKQMLNIIKRLFTYNRFTINYNEKLVIKRLNSSIEKLEEDYKLYKKYAVHEKASIIKEILKELKYIKTGKK